ncbi:MAG: aspartate-semialdehyde dehydrogenase [Candidatus Marinimicrobia bacterium]|nr:aspartate-semialdehyde dehydrogenase [Candidatus Neomarinimicrobiota bacterium]
MTTDRLKVGILGATGAVGQRFIQLLEGHPWFELSALYASERSAGKPYHEAVTWRVPVAQPAYAGELVVQTPAPAEDLDLVFSALPSQMAETMEPLFAEAGIPVISNASAYRMTSDVPLLIPEVNPEHTALIATQQAKRGWPGFIATNPNCAVVGLVLPLKPLHDAFGIESVRVVTLQAKSGAGYPGPPPEIIGDNVLPYIPGEEEKLQSEPLKLLGALAGDRIEDAHIILSAQCNRVDVLDGHTASVFINFTNRPSVDQASEALRAYKGIPQTAALPSAPQWPVVVLVDADRPQPKLDRDHDQGMAVTVGRLRSDALTDLMFTTLSHNTIRGAAGAAILNAELLKHQGIL